MGSVIIASIYPLAVVERRSRYQPQNEYALPAVAPGEIVHFEVFDATISDYMGHGRSSPRTIFADAIARDVVKCFTRGFPGVDYPDTCRPGIWICKGRVASDEERAENERVQNEFGRLCVQEADVFSGQNRPDLITRRHRVLADWMEVKGRPWQERIDRSAKEPCVFCGAMNPSFVSICGTCRSILNYQRHAATQAALEQGHIAKVQEAMQAARNATSNDLAQSDLEAVLAEYGLSEKGAAATGKAKG